MDIGNTEKLGPNSKFSYECTRCSQCCVNKKIQVNPFEIARLAAGFEIGFAAFRTEHTIDGVFLNQKSDGSCVFLGKRGCEVHADRPLVCRIFPLGRHITESGKVHYSNPAWNPMPNGEYGKNGKVQDYIDDQGVAEFAKFADAYFHWYCKARDYLERVDENNEALEYEDLLNIDEVIAKYCNINSLDEPIIVAERAKLHLEILNNIVSGD